MRKRIWWVVAVLAVLLAPIVWYLGSPLFINKTVDEPFPVAPTTHQTSHP